MPTTNELRQLRDLLGARDVAGLAALVRGLPPEQVVEVLRSLPPRQAAVAFRVLPKETAMVVFDWLQVPAQADLVAELGDADVAGIFAELEPDDQVELMDELPAKVAKRLVQSLSGDHLQAAMAVLGYPQGSVGRRMSPRYVHARPSERADVVIARGRR